VNITSRVLDVADVKKASARQQKAAATRRKMLQAAYDLFCELGYRATTMDAIADRAGVAVQTLYFTFHTKDELLQEVHEWTVLGDEELPPQLQPWYIDAAAEPDARRALRLFVAGLVTIEARNAPMLPVYHAVAADPAGEVYRRSAELRRAGFEEMVDLLRKKAPLRPGLSRRRATDIYFILASPESYRSFVIEAGWRPAEWVTWITDALSHALFGPVGSET
jgi:AcrR family transcriptional regulator